MKTFKELKASAKQLYDLLETELNYQVDSEGNVTQNIPDANRIEELVDSIQFPAVVTGTNFIIKGIMKEVDYTYWTSGGARSKVGLAFVEAHKFQVALWYATTRTLIETLQRMGFGENYETVYARMNTEYGRVNENELLLMTLLKELSKIEISKDSLVYGMTLVKQRIATFKRVIAQDGTDKKNGLDKIMSEGPQIGYLEADQLRKQLPPLMSQMPEQTMTSRTWGFEIESPDCKGVEPITNSGIEKGDDGSLRSYESQENCECDCDDCIYHECDCDECSIGSSDPEHCGNSSCATAESAEYRSVGGIQRSKHRGLHELCKELKEKDAEINETAGTHIHVYAADLTTHQVGQVMATYKRLEQLFSVVAGREDVSYARSVVVDHVRKAIKKTGAGLVSEKPVAVNVSNLFTDRGTIEFRQMDCNYEEDMITFWAWLMRGLVTCAKRGATVSNYIKVKDFNDLVNVYGKFNFFLASETPEQIIYGSRQDKFAFTKTQHARA